MAAVENKIADVSSLVTKTDCNTKIADIEMKITDHDHDTYITTSEFNKLTTENFQARLVQGNLVTKADLDDKLQNLNRKVTSNKTIHLLVGNELKKLQKFNAAYFKSKDYFGNNGTQSCSVFHPIEEYLKLLLKIILLLFHLGNLKDYLMKLLNLPLQLIIVLLI